jgi:hypothetical protein
MHVSQAWKTFLLCTHVMIIRNVYTYWKRFSVWSQNYRLYSWIFHRSYKFCSVATISWRNSLWFETWSMSRHMMYMMSDLEMSMQRRESRVTTMSVHADSRWDWQIKKSNVRADSQREMSEMLNWLRQIQMHELRQREQLMLMTQIQNDEHIHADEWKNTHKKIERITSNIRHANHRM